MKLPRLPTPIGGVGVGRTVGQGDDWLTIALETEDDGAPMSNRSCPHRVVKKMLPVVELMTMSLPLTGLLATLVMVKWPLRVGRGEAIRLLQQSKGAADAVDLKKLV